CWQMYLKTTILVASGHQNRRLQVHLPAVALPPAAGPEVLVDPSPQLRVEGTLAAELQRAAQPLGQQGGGFDRATAGVTAVEWEHHVRTMVARLGCRREGMRLTARPDSVMI